MQGTGSISVNASGSSQTGFLKFNVGEKGFYRVKYDNQEWNAISDALSTDLNVQITSDDFTYVVILC